MNTLVIGGNGFIGSHLVDHLLLNGHSVRVFDIAHERHRAPLSKVDYRISTLSNIPELYEALLGIDIVFHLATASVPSTSNINTVSDVTENLIPTLNILNLSVKLGIKRFIYFSSGGAVYGNSKNEYIKEEHHLKPISSYGILKVTIENYLYLYKRLYNINPLILRPSNPYGPRQGHFIAQGVISTFLKQVKANSSITVYGDGSASKDYIYIDDLVDQCYRLSMTAETGIFNIGSGKGISLTQIIETIEKITNTKCSIEYIDKKDYDVTHFVLDTGKTMSVLGSSPSISLEMGISKLWSWLNSNPL